MVMMGGLSSSSSASAMSEQAMAAARGEGVRTEDDPEVDADVFDPLLPTLQIDGRL